MFCVLGVVCFVFWVLCVLCFGCFVFCVLGVVCVVLLCTQSHAPMCLMSIIHSRFPASFYSGFQTTLHSQFLFNDIIITSIEL